MSNITTEQMRFWSPEVRELEPYVPGEQPKFIKAQYQRKPISAITKSG